jgi:iron complex outermembrane recepter protein
VGRDLRGRRRVHSARHQRRLPLGPNGFANLSLQWKDQDRTSRSLQRNDAAGLIATGNTAVADPAQPWGSPELTDDWTFFVNAGIDLTDSQDLYGFGHYAERKQANGFFYRNPNNRGLVFTGDQVRRLRAIMDTDLAASPVRCPIARRSRPPAGRSTTAARCRCGLPANCFAFNAGSPAASRRTSAPNSRTSAAPSACAATFDNGLLYDFSVRLARNEVASSWTTRSTRRWARTAPPRSTWASTSRPSRTTTPTSATRQGIDGLYSPLNVAFGAEYRVEMFEIRLGEQASWEAGPYAFQNATSTPTA